jgi:hypothetical protein
MALFVSGEGQSDRVYRQLVMLSIMMLMLLMMSTVDAYGALVKRVVIVEEVKFVARRAKSVTFPSVHTKTEVLDGRRNFSGPMPCAANRLCN